MRSELLKTSVEPGGKIFGEDDTIGSWAGIAN